MRPTRSGTRPVNEPKIRNVEDEKPPKILPETHFAAGMLFERQGQVDKAVTQYRKAVALNHHYVAAYHRLGLVLSAVGHHDDALVALQRAAELRPENAAIRNNLGFEYLLTGQFAEAEDALRQAVRLQPTFARAHINLGLVLAKTGRFDDALVSFRQVLPEADAYYNLGLVFRGQQRYLEAITAFERTLSLDPEFTAARTQLAEINARMPAPPKADAEPAPQAVVAEAPVVEPPDVREEPMPQAREEAPWAPTPAEMEVLAIVDAILMPTPAEPPSEPVVEPPQPQAEDVGPLWAEAMAVPTASAEVPALPTLPAEEFEEFVEAGTPAERPEMTGEDVRVAAPVGEPFEEDCDVAVRAQPAVEPVEMAMMPEPNAHEEPAVVVADATIMPDAMIHPMTVTQPYEAGEPDADEIITVFPTATITEPAAMRDSWMMLEELETKIALLRQDLGAPALAYVPTMPLVVEADGDAALEGPPVMEPSTGDDEAFDETPVVHTDEEKVDIDAQDPTAMVEPVPGAPMTVEPSFVESAFMASSFAAPMSQEPKVVEVMFIEPPAEPYELAVSASAAEFAWVEAFGDLEALLSVVINETQCWDQFDAEPDDALVLSPLEPCADDAAAGSMANDTVPAIQPEEAFEEFVEEETQTAKLDDGSR